MGPAESLAKGVPGLMVCFLGLENGEASHASFNEVGSENSPVRLEQLAGSMVAGSSPLKTRLVATQKGVDPRFRILMIPVTGGGVLPKVAYDFKSEIATVAWADQKDSIRFSVAKDQRSRVICQRDSKKSGDTKN